MTVVDISAVQAEPGIELTHKQLIDEKLWERLVNRIVEDEKIERHFAERIMDQALGFLALVKYEPEGRFSPSELVDIGWHTFILYTKPYADFCKEHVGRFIHHNPTDDPDVDYSVEEGSMSTTDAMMRHGLKVDEPLWAHFHEGDCSNCNGGQGCQCGSCNY